MENQIKVGQSFEVVEIMGSNFAPTLFKIGGHTVVLGIRVLTNGEEYYHITHKHLGQHCAVMLHKHTKTIGKLTIKSLK